MEPEINSWTRASVWKHYAPNICLPLKMAKLTKCQNSRLFFLICSKVNQVIYSSSPKMLTMLQAPSLNSFREILLTSLKCPNLQRAITPETIDRICSKVNQIIHLSSPISCPSCKPLVQILFKMSCWQDFNLIFSKGHSSRKVNNPDKKKNMGQLFFHEESIYEISKP